MIDTIQGCNVASYTKINSATNQPNNATRHATNIATVDLLTLSNDVLSRNQCNRSDNLNATHPLQTSATKKSCVVASRKGCNYATGELRFLIRKISDYYGGDDKEFLEEYIHDIISKWSDNIDVALECFRNISNQIPVKNRT